MNKQEPQNLFPWTQSSLYQSLSYVSLVSFSAKPLKQVLFVCCIYCLHYFTSHLFLNPRQPGFSPHLSKNALARVTNSLLAATSSGHSTRLSSPTGHLSSMGHEPILPSWSIFLAQLLSPFAPSFPPLDALFPFHLLVPSFPSKPRTPFLI